VACFVVACTPLHGHVTPLLGIMAELTRRGHDVIGCTGRRFAGEVTGVGARFVPLPAEADYDDRRVEAVFGGSRPDGRLRRINADISRLLADPLPAQHRLLGRLVDDWAPAAVLVDTTFLGAFTWRSVRTTPRPPLAVANITFLALRGRGVPPPGPGFRPAPGLGGGTRDLLVRAVTDRLLVRGGLLRLDRAAREVTGRTVPGLLFDGPRLADLVLVLTVPSFEYPRSDLPPSVRFVGPVEPPVRAVRSPSWWSDLDGSRRVVHVTQGTMDTTDLGVLVAPTLRALADEDLLVVATTGGRPPEAVPGPLPPNARVARYLPYANLLPLVDVMVTNGGYGGVQQALAAGVPLVVAGSGEDKPEVAARVARSGAGIDLRTGRPRPAALRSAVARVLTDGRYRDRARALRDEMAGYGGARLAVDHLEVLAGAGQAVAGGR
jgi:UDP:flavonoid glycosyltransferase YjiC (YdhE family)